MSKRQHIANVLYYVRIGIDADGQYTIGYRGADTNAAEWAKTYQNMLGRTSKIIYSGGYTNTITYDSYGRQIKQSDGITTTLTAYNAKGNAYRNAVDMDGDDTIDIGETDHVTESATSYTTFQSENVRQTDSKIYQTNNSSVATTVSITYSAVDGLDSWSVSFDRTNHTTVAFDRANAARTETSTHLDGTQSISYYTNGLLMSAQNLSSAFSVISAVNYSYDSWSRLSTISETVANGDTRTTTYSYNAAGVVTTSTVSAASTTLTTSYEFDAMGRRTKTILPDAGEVTYQYNTTGAITNQSGARTYPVTYTYTDQSRMNTMSTYRNGLSGGADTTTWNYDSQRGWLTAKIYADGSTNSYEYFDNGALKKRTWARGLYTEYLYDNGGSLTNVNYSDSTPDITYTRDRLGRAAEITDTAGTYTNFYAADGSLDSVTLPQLSGYTLDYIHDALGRLTNLSLLNPVSSVEFQVSYTFDNAGRLSTVSDGADTVTYSYGWDGVTATNLSFGGPMNVSKSFDGLNRLTQISNVPTNGSTLSYSYTYNSANQRIENTLADSSKWVYEYDSLGQVISGKKYFSDGTPVGGSQFEYDFDQIGNRKTIKNFRGSDSKTSTYTANNLNQYSQRTVPGEIFVTGTVATNATVTVRLGTNNASRTARHDDYFWKPLDVDNSSALFSTTNLQIRAYKASGTNSLTKLETKEAIVPQTPETFTFDGDGNLLNDGTWTNTWNGENRLVTMESLSAVPDAFKKKVEFKYDYQGRRFEKTSYSDYSGGSYGTTNVITFIYNGWNLIAEVQDIGTTNYFTWGADLSGSLQGAGGVGGLLIAQVNSTNYFPCFDGNGNVMGLVDEDGSVVASYEYSPFGKIIKATGSMASLNKFRFSTKYFDDETGRSYYGFRYYDTYTGRWLNRDPIGEDGGVGLYGFVQNGPIWLIDALGLETLALTLLEGPNISGYETFWGETKKIVQRKTRNRPDKGKYVCFKREVGVGREQLAVSLEEGYGFLVAHGVLYYDSLMVARAGGRLTLKQAVKYAQKQASRIQTGKHRKKWREWTTAKRKFETKSNQSMIRRYNERMQDYLAGSVPNKPLATGVYPAPGAEPLLKQIQVTTRDLVGKVYLLDGMFELKEVLAREPKNSVAKWLKSYGCYAGHMKSATVHGIRVGAGHDYVDYVRGLDVLPSIKGDVMKLINGKLKEYRVIDRK